MEMELRSVENPLNELVLAKSEQVLLRDFFMDENGNQYQIVKGILHQTKESYIKLVNHT